VCVKACSRLWRCAAAAAPTVASAVAATLALQIGEDNIGSLALFQGLGFERCNYVAAFREVELQFVPGEGRPLPACDVFSAGAAPDLGILTRRDHGEPGHEADTA
jgi:hypothetical protein